MEKIIDFFNLNTDKLDRKKFVTTIIKAYTLPILIFLYPSIFPIQSNGDAWLSYWLVSLIILGALASYITLSAIVKRVKDIGYSPFFAFIILAPFVNIVFFLYLCLKKSK